ncbi:MAG: hypothetical protein Q4G45_11730 [Actinomycetia bacterium]|nr:hypothetical protein [Actinomycetes bacterium]
MNRYVIAPDLVVEADGVARLGPEEPALGISWPQCTVGPDGADSLTWQVRTCDTDDDEVYVELVAGSLRATLRQSVVAGTWRLRASLHSTGPEPVTVSAVSLRLDPGQGLVRVWGAGAAGLVALASSDQPGRPWALVLRRGQLTDTAGRLVWLPDGTRLDPGQRLVLDLDGRRCLDWESVGDRLPSWLPVDAVTLPQPVELRLPDAAVSALDCEVVEDGWATLITGSGRAQVAVRGSFGEVGLELSFAPSVRTAAQSLARQLARLAREVPGAILQSDGTGPERRAQALERTARRLLVLQASRAQVREQDLVRGWLLDGVTHLLVTGGQPGASTIAALAGEVQRGDGQAEAVLLEAVPVLPDEPGLGLTLSRAWVALWGAGAEVDVVRAAMERLRPGSDPVSQVEHHLLTGSGHEQQVLGRWEGLLGGGLPGRLHPEPEPTETARLVAATALLPESGDRRAGPVLVAAEIASRRLLAAYPDDPDVLAWLLLAQRD